MLSFLECIKKYKNIKIRTKNIQDAKGFEYRILRLIKSSLELNMEKIVYQLKKGEQTCILPLTETYLTYAMEDLIAMEILLKEYKTGGFLCKKL